MKDLLLKIASVFYGAAIKLRHLLFDINVLHSEKFDIPIICVGNITVGGTGKTPTVEMLVEHYSKECNVVVSDDSIVATITLENGDKAPVWTYNIKGREIHAICVHHPCIGKGRKWRYWHQFYKKFLGLSE